MKKLIGFVAMSLVLVLAACADKPAEVKKEIIVVPSTTPVIIVKDPPVNTTTVTVDKNGVKIEAKKKNN